MSGNVVIHVGFSRTGTTTLQRHLFARHPQIKYPGKPYADETLKELLHRLMMEDSLTYDPAPLADYVRDYGKDGGLREPGEGKRVTVLSDEMFLSYSKVRDKGLVARRLLEVFSPCKILFTIRNQLELLKSAYLSRGRFLLNVPRRFSGLGVGFGDWLELSREQVHGGYLSHADYFKTIDYYRRLFGADNVCVMPLELFADQRETYLARLSEFLGIDADRMPPQLTGAHEHRDISRAELDYQLLCARFFPFHRFPAVTLPLKIYTRMKAMFGGRFGKIFGGKSAADATVGLSIPPGWERPLGDLYRDGNRQLAATLDFPLEKYGYPL